MVFLKEFNIKKKIPCIIVFSHQRHVDYINSILNPVQDALIQYGFKVQLLSDETPTDDYIGDYFERLVEKCALAVIILDGLRPNVVYEYGFLRGKNKPLILLQDKDAEIAIKSLYHNWKDQKETGLTSSKMEILKDPNLGFFRSFSDRAGVRVSIVERNTRKNHSSNPMQVIINELEKIKSKIIEEFKSLDLKPEEKRDVTYKHLSQNTVNRIVDYVVNKEKLNETDLEVIYQNIKKLENNYCKLISPMIYQHLANLFINLARNRIRDEPESNERIRKYYGRAISLLNTLIEYEIEPIQLSKSYLYLGKIYLDSSNYYNKLENCKKSIDLFNLALNPYITDYFEDIFAEIKLNLGVAYIRLANIEDRAKNCWNAINSLNHALEIWTFQENKKGYASLKFNLGVANNELSKVENKIDNCKKSIEAFNETLKIWTFEDTPKKFALLQQKLGDTYHILSEIENKNENSEKAIESLMQALKVFTEKDFPKENGVILQILAKIYFLRADFEKKIENCKKSMEANKNAIKYFTIEKFPKDYANIQNNIGITYLMLSSVDKTADNCEKALEAFDKVIKIAKKTDNPEKYAVTQFYMGDAYSILSKIKKNMKEYCKKGINAYREALEYFKDKTDSKFYFQSNYKLHELQVFCKNIRI